MILQAGGLKMDEEIRWGEKRSNWLQRAPRDTLPKCSDLPVFSCKMSDMVMEVVQFEKNIAPLPERQKTPEFAFYICEFVLYQYDNCYLTCDSEFWFAIPRILGLLYLPSYGSSDDRGSLSRLWLFSLRHILGVALSQDASEQQDYTPENQHDIGTWPCSIGNTLTHSWWMFQQSSC